MEIVIFKKDNLRLGLIFGLVAPIVSLIIYYFVKFVACQSKIKKIKMVLNLHTFF